MLHSIQPYAFCLALVTGTALIACILTHMAGDPAIEIEKETSCTF